MRARDDDKRLQSFRWLGCFGSAQAQAATPSTKRPECALVCGAGSDNFNGIYVAEDAKSVGGTFASKSSVGTFSGVRQNRPFKFRKLDGKEALICFGGFWILNEGGTGTSMYGVRMMMLAMTPPETGWQVKCGRGPAPRLVTFSELGSVPRLLRQPGGYHLSMLEVRGAGSAAFNGKYYMHTVRNGTASYRKEDGPHVIVHEQDCWLLSEAAGDESRYGFHCPLAGLMPPDDAVWSFRGGRVPAPVVRRSGALQEEPLDEELRGLCDMQDLLDGHWQSEHSTLEDYTAAICGTSLTWWDGPREDILFDAHGKVTVLGSTGHRTAELGSTAPMKLIWSTGDVWAKVSIASPDPRPRRSARKLVMNQCHMLSSSFGSGESLLSSFGTGKDDLSCDGLSRTCHVSYDSRALAHKQGKRDAGLRQVDSCSTAASSLAMGASLPSRASSGISPQPSAEQVASLADEVCGSLSPECLKEHHLLDSVTSSKEGQHFVIDSVEDTPASDQVHMQSSLTETKIRSEDKSVYAQELQPAAEDPVAKVASSADEVCGNVSPECLKEHHLLEAVTSNKESQHLVIHSVEDVPATDQAHVQSRVAETKNRLEDESMDAQELQQSAEEDPVEIEESEPPSLQPGIQGFVSKRVLAFSKRSCTIGRCALPVGTDHGTVSELVQEHQRFIQELSQGSWNPLSFQAAS